MAFGDTVGTPVSNDGTSVGSLAVTFGAATAGNMLIAGFARSVAANWGSDPTGWSALTSVPNGSGNMSARWYYKIAAGGETSLTATTTETTGTFRGVVAEFEGPFAVVPLDVTAEDETNISTIVTSQSSGTTGTTAQADALAIAFFAADSAFNVDGSRAYSNSFAEVVFGSATVNAGRALAALAKKVLSATGTQQTTFSCSDTGDEMYGAVAVFSKLVAGGGVVGPLLGGHLVKRGILQGRLVR